MSRLTARSRLMSLAVLAAVLVLTGCQPYIQYDQTSADLPFTVSANQSLGQTFVAEYDGMEGVQLYLAPGSGNAGDLVLRLRSEPGSTTDLAVSRMPVSELTTSRYYNFNFPPQAHSHSQYYYALLEVDGEAQVQVLGSAGDAYLHGSVYTNKEPGEGQLAFRLSYHLPGLLGGVLRLAWGWMGVLLAGSLLFVLPGWALLSWAWSGFDRLLWPEKLGLAGGLSLAVYPVLFLWTSLVGLRLGMLYAWIPIVASAAALVWKGWRARRAAGRTRRVFSPGFAWPTLFSSSALPHIAFLAASGLVIFTRFWAVRTLDLPLFGDSYQHTMITQLMVDHGGLFQSWQPYADLNQFTYHFGFHSLAAVYHWITGQGAASSVLWVGQIANLLAVFGLYPLAFKVGKSPWAGVTAVVVGGLLSPMPMEYVNWGRYTQLAGQAILPAALYLGWNAFDRHSVSGEPQRLKNPTWRLALLTGLAMGGLALSHYRVLIIGVLFFPVYLSFQTCRKGRFVPALQKVMVAGSLGGLLFVPWFGHVYGAKILRIFTRQITTAPQSTAASTLEYNAIGSLLHYLPAGIWLMMVLCTVWLLWKRSQPAAILAAWWFLALVAANPQWLSLPGAGAISSFAVMIMAYIPAAVLLGAAAAAWIQPVEPPEGEARPLLPRERDLFLAKPAALLAVLLLLGVQGAWQRARAVDPETYLLAARPDLRAAEWIEANTSPEARLLVNTFFAFGDSAIVGSDGGWWLPLLADRQTNLPPLVYSLESEPWAGYTRWINGLTAEVQAKGINHADILASLAERDITHVYIGQRQGRVNYTGPYVLDPVELSASPHYRQVYHMDRVWIFEVVP